MFFYESLRRLQTRETRTLKSYQMVKKLSFYKDIKQKSFYKRKRLKSRLHIAYPYWQYLGPLGAHENIYFYFLNVYKNNLKLSSLIWD